MVTETEVPQLKQEITDIRRDIGDLQARIRGVSVDRSDLVAIHRAAIDAERHAARITGRYINLRPREDDKMPAPMPGFGEVFGDAHDLRDDAMAIIRECADRLWGAESKP